MSKIFEFKSSGVFFEKEREGIKNNTIREIDLSDDRFLQLIQHNMNGYNDGDLKIKIIDAGSVGKFVLKVDGEYESIENSFVRDIKDISIYKNWMIITWKHEEGKDGKENK